MRSYLKRKERPFGTHVLFVDVAWRGRAISLADMDDDVIDHMIALGFDAGILLTHRITLSGRHGDGLKREIVATLKSARKCRLWKTWRDRMCG